MQYRGFGCLHSRVLLAQQCDIEALERELDEIDLWDQEEGAANKLKNKQRDDRQCSKDDMADDFPFPRTRPEILQELRKQLIEYGQCETNSQTQATWLIRDADTMLLKAKEMANMQAPSARDWRSVKSWISNHAPLVEREQSFILKKEDLVTLRSGRECAGFDGVIERMLARTDEFLQKRLGWNIIQVSSPDHIRRI